MIGGVLVMASLLAGSALSAGPALDEGRLESFAKLSLSCLNQEYPNRPNLTLDSGKDLQSNRDLHPIFYGCYDWHSAVHAHWALARVLGLTKNGDLKKRIVEALSRSFVADKVAVETKYFSDHSDAERFERPYGYGWLLRLMMQLRAIPEGAEWAKTLEPLEARLRALFLKVFDRYDFPVRTGLHENLAFSLAHAFDYAVSRKDEEFLGMIRTKAMKFYAKDKTCPMAFEPSGEDFLSPCLAEAEVMARVMEPKAFAGWLKAFLDPKALPRFLEPISPSADALKDPRTVHLVGLNFQKAWALRRVAKALGAKDKLRAKLIASADLHRTKSTELMFKPDYGGTHWLASFALFDWTDAGLE